MVEMNKDVLFNKLNTDVVIIPLLENDCVTSIKSIFTREKTFFSTLPKRIRKFITMELKSLTVVGCIPTNTFIQLPNNEEFQGAKVLVYLFEKSKKVNNGDSGMYTKSISKFEKDLQYLICKNKYQTIDIPDLTTIFSKSMSSSFFLDFDLNSYLKNLHPIKFRIYEISKCLNIE